MDEKDIKILIYCSSLSYLMEEYPHLFPEDEVEEISGGIEEYVSKCKYHDLLEEDIVKCLKDYMVNKIKKGEF